MSSFYGFTLLELKCFLEERGIWSGQCPELFRTVYHRGFEAIKKNPQLGGPGLQLILKELDFKLPKIVKVQESSDKTVKLLFELADGHRVESVLIPFWKRYTVCLSSQVGCAMNCSFCYTGKQGLSRHLKASEIVGQYLVGRNWLTEKSLSRVTPNIVFMGQGEPLHNFDEVKKAISLFLSVPGLALGPRQLTLSTVGHLPGLERLRELPPINLALSLHATKDSLRDKLIPLNQKYNLEKIFQLLDQLPLEGSKLINYEYLLIKDVNDSQSDANLLADLLKNRKAIVNLISFNEFPGCSYQRPSDGDIERFKSLLVKRKIRTMIRTTKGENILAACGQLANS